MGKTEIAVELAGLLRARGEDPVAVSADAIAVYEGLDVLAAKPATDRLEHRLVSCVPIDEEFSAGRFAALAHAEIDGLLDAGEDPDRRRRDRALPARRVDGARPAPAGRARPA